MQVKNGEAEYFGILQLSLPVYAAVKMIEMPAQKRSWQKKFQLLLSYPMLL